VKKSKYSDPDINKIPSPSPNSTDFIFSVIEGDIPLVNLLNILIVWNTLELLIVILLFFMITHKYLKKFIIKMIYYLINKFIPSKLDTLDKYLKNMINYNDKFITILSIIIII